MSLLRFGFLFLLVIVAAESATQKESCAPENCVLSNMCEEPVKDAFCPNKGRICCSVIKDEFRTHCRHHGGECMNNCTVLLQRPVVDCPVDKVCCVLV